MIIVGLTGGFGCGKSTIAGLLKRLPRVDVVDCDAVAKAIMASDGFRPELAAVFGPAAIAADGHLDTAAIAASIFADDAKRRRLEAALHPLVREAVERQRQTAAAAGIRLFVIESAILFETAYDAECGIVVCVACDPAEQRRRLRENRGYDDAQIDARLAAQMPLTEKIRRAGIVFTTDCAPADLPALVNDLYLKLLQTS